MLTENYLQKLYTTYEQEIRGENKPIENPDRRPNYIGMCINMMETAPMKIKCLRKVKEMTAMNPFYQYRIDRFIDAITDTYEPTQRPGFTEYIRGEQDALTEDLKHDLRRDRNQITYHSKIRPKMVQRLTSAQTRPDEQQKIIKRLKKFDRMFSNESLSFYLGFLNDQAPPKGPPPKVVQLKASGAEQDDEEPPTTTRTKKFEKDEAKVGMKEALEAMVNEVDPLTLGTLLHTTPWQKAGLAAAAAGGAYMLGKKTKADLARRCHYKYQGYPDRIRQCLQGERS
jgi:hypothetical protein